MATIVLGDNPGPSKVEPLGGGSYPQVDVTLRDGEGATCILPYTDLETLTETIALLVEARDKLTVELVAEYGAESPVSRIAPGWAVVIDGAIVEVTAVQGHGDVIGVSFPPGQSLKVFADGSVAGYLAGYREFPRDGTVTRIVRPVDLLTQLEDDVVR